MEISSANSGSQPTRPLFEQLEQRLLLSAVSGHIDVDTVWDNLNEPYEVTADLYVDAGVTLTIASGVEVQTMGPDFNVYVDGTMIAWGVSFTSGQTDIRARAGGQLVLDASDVVGGHLEYGVGSQGRIANSSLGYTSVLFFTDNAALRSSTLEGTITVDDALPDLRDNSFLEEFHALGDPELHIDARWNYWGTSDPAEIAAKITDHYNDPSRPYVDFDGFHTELPANVYYNPGTGHYYERVDTVMTWPEANAAANARSYWGVSGHLVTITSEAENDWITANFLEDLTERAYFHLGGFQPANASEPDGDWQWVTGELWSYTNWNQGEPNDISPGGEDYLQTSDNTSNIGTWNDGTDHFPHVFGYIVEYEGTALQGASDLALGPDDLLLTPEGSDYEVTATIHNLGDLAVGNFVVQYCDLDSGSVIGSQTVTSLNGYASTVLALVVWTPSGPGARIEVTIDPFDEIEEASNANNRAEAVASLPGDSPEVMDILAAWDGDGLVDAFGRYVSGVELLNTFEATVLDGDGASDVHHVTFTLGALGSLTDYSSSGGWTADFDMGQLTADTTLEVIAYDTFGNPSDPLTGTVHVVDFPTWLGSADEDDTFGGGYYHLNGFVPEQLDVTHTMPADWWIIGGLESSFRLGIELGLTAGLDAGQDVPVDHKFVFEAKVLDQDLFGYSVDPFTFDVGGVTMSFSALAEGDDLSLTGLSAGLQATGMTLFDGSVIGPSYTVIVPVGIIPIPVTVSTGMNYSLTLDVELYLGWDVVNGEVEILEGTYFAPTVTAEPYLFGGIGIPGLNAGLEVGGELGLHYRGEYDSISGYEDYLWGSFGLNFRVVATAGAKFVLAEWTMPAPGDPQWTFGDPPPPGGAPVTSGATLGGDGAVLPEPDLAADDTGQVLLVRAMDGDPAPGNVDSDIFYAVRDAGGSWSLLSAVASGATIDSDPTAAFDGAGGAVVSWAANTIDPALVETTPWQDYLQTQEIYSAYWNGSSWSSLQPVTSDSAMDGPPQVAFHNGSGLMLWEHAGGVDGTDLDGYDLRYAVWDDVAHMWGTPQALTADGEGDWSPAVGYAPDGTAMAAWVHDDDSDPTTAELWYATWDGGSWSAPAIVPLSSTAGVKEPRLAFDSAGNALLAWLGNEGGADILYTATWDAGAATWSGPQAVGGTPSFMEGLDLTVSGADEAMLLWHGWDGQNDVFATVRDLGSSDPWTPPARLTDNADGEWMASATFDATEQPVVVWANESATTVFGPHTEGVELALATDLQAANVQVAAVELLEGQQTPLTVEVTNIGWAASVATDVEFYVGDPAGGGTLIGSPVSISGLAVGESVVVASDVFTLPAGTNDYYAVVATVGGEIETANNTTSISAESVPPDTTPPLVTGNVPEDGFVAHGAGILILSFDEAVASLTEGNISLVESRTGFVAPDHVYLAPTGDEATLVFEGGLARGSYTFKVLDSVTDSAGNALDGDADGNSGEDYVCSFYVLMADYDGDGVIGSTDIDDLFAHFGLAGQVNPVYDLDGDGDADADDAAYLVHEILGTEFGDLNLDGFVNVTDLAGMKAGFGQDGMGWAGGDLNGDGLVTATDLAILKANFGFEKSAEGDFNRDGIVDALDIDGLFDNFGAQGWINPKYDLDGDGDADDEDMGILVHDILNTEFGDLNLDGHVNATDLAGLKAGFGRDDMGWAGGDLNGDGFVNVTDLAIMKVNFGFEAIGQPLVVSSALKLAPEATSMPDAPQPAESVTLSTPTLAVPETSPMLQSTPPQLHDDVLRTDAIVDSLERPAWPRNIIADAAADHSVPAPRGLRFAPSGPRNGDAQPQPAPPMAGILSASAGDLSEPEDELDDILAISSMDITLAPAIRRSFRD